MAWCHQATSHYLSLCCQIDVATWRHCAHSKSMFHWAVPHYNDVTMGSIASQITSLTIVYSAVYSDADQRKYQSSASLAFVQGIHRAPGEFPAQMASNAKNVSIWWRHHVSQCSSRSCHDWFWRSLRLYPHCHHCLFDVPAAPATMFFNKTTWAHSLSSRSSQYSSCSCHDGFRRRLRLYPHRGEPGES